MNILSCGFFILPSENIRSPIQNPNAFGIQAHTVVLDSDPHCIFATKKLLGDFFKIKFFSSDWRKRITDHKIRRIFQRFVPPISTDAENWDEVSVLASNDNRLWKTLPRHWMFSRHKVHRSYARTGKFILSTHMLVVYMSRKGPLVVRGDVRLRWGFLSWYKNAKLSSSCSFWETLMELGSGIEGDLMQSYLE